MLKYDERKIYKVKDGQSLKSLANELSTTEYALIQANGLKEELFAGQILLLPPSRNVYVVQAGDTKSLLCGSAEKYEERNGTGIFYIGMRVRL